MKIPAALTVLCLFIGLTSCNENVEKPPNVLFIAVDDLRPDLGAYQHPQVQSPNIDALASTGVTFLNHYVTVPTCGASRAGLLTGQLPMSRDYLSNQVFRDVISKQQVSDKSETFVHYLRQNGYYTVGIGKISHSPDGLIYGYDEPVGTELELPNSWDEMLMDYGNWGTGWNTFFAYAGGSNRTDQNKNVKPYEAGDVSDEGYPDGLIANLAVNKLNELANQKKPFFLGVGFFKPHLPFNAPKKYWDLYDRDSMPLSPNPFIPTDINQASLHQNGEFNQYQLGEEKATLDSAISNDYARKLIHGYLACISYTDRQIGKLLDELKRLQLEDNTIIILWGDHGWHLGDQRIWGKHTLFDRALRSPLIMRLPGMTHGTTSEHIVSTIDIYPSIVELCGLPIPKGIDGQTLTPLLNSVNPNWDDRAFSYFRNGITLRTKGHRITKFFREEQPTVELFDHQVDPFETINVADSDTELVRELLEYLDQGDTGLYDQHK